MLENAHILVKLGDIVEYNIPILHKMENKRHGSILRASNLF